MQRLEYSQWITIFQSTIFFKCAFNLFLSLFFFACFSCVSPVHIFWAHKAFDNVNTNLFIDLHLYLLRKIGTVNSMIKNNIKYLYNTFETKYKDFDKVNIHNILMINYAVTLMNRKPQRDCNLITHRPKNSSLLLCVLCRIISVKDV